MKDVDEDLKKSTGKVASTVIDLPSTVNVLGVDYTITYVDKPSDVDIYRRKSLWGQVDYWTRSIRILAGDRPLQDVWISVVHETLHAIVDQLNIGKLDEEDREEIVELLAMALVDVLVRNGWMEIE